MTHCRALSLLYLCLAASMGMAGLYSDSASAAEEELTLLTIQGDLVGKIESLVGSNDPELIIRSYYDLLPEELQAEVAILRLRLSALVPDYQVAFAAADRAELVDVMDEFDVHLTQIRSIHAQEFTLEVVEILNNAYAEAYSMIGPEQSRQPE